MFNQKILNEHIFLSIITWEYSSVAQRWSIRLFLENRYPFVFVYTLVFSFFPDWQSFVIVIILTVFVCLYRSRVASILLLIVYILDRFIYISTIFFPQKSLTLIQSSGFFHSNLGINFYSSNQGNVCVSPP